MVSRVGRVHRKMNLCPALPGASLITVVRRTGVTGLPRGENLAGLPRIVEIDDNGYRRAGSLSIGIAVVLKTNPLCQLCCNLVKVCLDW